MLRKLLSCCALPLILILSNSSGNSAPNAPEGFTPVPGPDIITGNIGELGDLEQYGESGSQVGLGVSTTSCNAGDVQIQFVALPDTRHPVIMHNLYRMSGGSGNDDRFEQVGQSWVKHAFGADQFETCFPCTPGNFSHLGVGCSDTYANFQSAGQTDLGSRAWINPFTGVFQTTDNNHNGHVHTGTSHRLLVEKSDLNTTLNPGATYYAEVQYISSDEYAWCQTHPGQCNMYNNASYVRYNVIGTTSFSFVQASLVVRMLGAIHVWTGATINTIEPEPGNDGRAFVAYKVTNPSPGLWHYEYAVYNENLDRAIQSFSVPLGCAISVSNLGFHAPPNPPGFPNDGTQGGLGFSNAPWASSQTTDAVSWNSETFAQNQNANAIRWGTLYNFRFDSNKPPVATNATIGYFKTGTPTTVAILGPNACDVVPSPTPTVTPGVTPGPTPTATPISSATPGGSPTPTATPGGAARALQLSTRTLVQTGDSAGIGGFIITGTGPKQVMVRADGPSSVPGALADPMLELHGPPGFATLINDDCEPGWIPSPFCPGGSHSSAIVTTLQPGAYTAIVRGKNDTSGIALVEVYDVKQGADSKLANISTRAFVSTADNIVIAGFILGGNSGTDQIVIRGLGPSLASLGVANALANPTLELRDSNGVLLMSNDDWQDTATMIPPPAGLAPTRPLESVIVATLPPGLYTALLAGKNGGTGVGLVEVYDLGAP